MAKFSPVPGTADIFPAESREWRFLEQKACEVFESYAYGQLRTPIFEYTEVFTRGLGDDTEVVKKEMYTFEDRGGRSLTLRPEGTAGVMRALLNTDVLNGVEQRVYYYGPMFRGERPAAGRRRQFHQLGAECVGRVSPELDAESIAMLMRLLRELGLDDAALKINTRGVAADRGPAGDALRSYFAQHIATMCADCKERLERNVWRILDCKCEECRNVVAEAPSYVDFFTAESREYFRKVCESLTALGIDYAVDPLLVRGLDYYVHTVFEVTHSGLGAQNAIAGGGRYELSLPGENRVVKGVGFAAGMERLMLSREARGIALAEEEDSKLIMLASLGGAARMENMRLAEELRTEGFSVYCEVEEKSLKAQLRTANRLGAAYAVIRGDEELANQLVQLKDFADGEQLTMPLAGLLPFLYGKIKG